VVLKGWFFFTRRRENAISEASDITTDNSLGEGKGVLKTLIMYKIDNGELREEAAFSTKVRDEHILRRRGQKDFTCRKRMLIPFSSSWQEGGGDSQEGNRKDSPGGGFLSRNLLRALTERSLRTHKKNSQGGGFFLLLRHYVYNREFLLPGKRKGKKRPLNEMICKDLFRKN